MSGLIRLAAEKRALVLTVFIIGYLLVLISNLLTRAPWVDEAYIANPAWNLASHGFMGTTSIEMAGSHWTRVDQRTYNTFPVGILNLALWFKVFGFSLAIARLPSLLFAGVLLYAIYRLLLALDMSRVLAGAAVFLLAVDYNFMIAATFGRLDMLCAALGFSALAVYSVLRPSHSAKAVLAACSLATLSLFTHPNGILFLPALVVLEVLGFRMSIRWRTAALGVIPLAIGAGCFLLYVLQDWKGAIEQLQSNTYPGRLTGFLHPFNAIRDEITGRYLTAYGLTLGDHPSGPVRARGLILLAYMGALIGAMSLREIRRTRVNRIILTLLALFTVYLTFFEGTRFTYYMVFVTPLYCILLVSVVHYFWNRRTQVAITVAVVLLTMLQLGGVIYRSVQNPYGRSFLPAAAFLKSRASATDLVFAGSDFGFAYGYDRNAKEEISLGYRSGIDPEYIVVDTSMAKNMRDWRFKEPEIYAYMVRRLKTYSPIYNSGTYQIYQKPR